MSIKEFNNREARKVGLRMNIISHFSEHSGQPTVMKVKFPSGKDFTIATGDMVGTLSGSQKSETKGFLRDLLYTGKSQRVT